jgi:hypothetical protein
MSQEKISAAKAAQVYSAVPGVLRALVTERDELLEKNAELSQQLGERNHRDRIEKIARTMEKKGIDTDTPFEDKVERIEKAAEAGKSLDVIEEAIEMTAPNGEIAKLAEDVSGNGADQLTAYLLGDLSE